MVVAWRRVGHELRFLNAGDELVLVDAWRGASAFADNAVEVPTQDALRLLVQELHRDRSLVSAARDVLADLGGTELRLFNVSDRGVVEMLSRELSRFAPRLRLLRVPRVRFSVPTPPDLPKQDTVEAVAEELLTLEIETRDQQPEPVPFLFYRVTPPGAGKDRVGALSGLGYGYESGLAAGQATVSFPLREVEHDALPVVTWAAIALVDDHDVAIANEPFEARLGDQVVASGMLDSSGRAFVSLPADGDVTVTFPLLTEERWARVKAPVVPPPVIVPKAEVEPEARAAPSEAEPTPVPVPDNPAHLVRMTGMFFDTNKCFLLPSAIEGMQKLVGVYNDHSSGEVLVVGHTDTSGEPDYNDKLSLERAHSVIAYLTDNADAWLAFYADAIPQKKRWGASEDTAMFIKVTGNASMTKQALKDYQQSKGLTNDGMIGPKSRKQLITDYMALDGTSLPAGITPIAHGCGESFPVENTGDGQNEEKNRRVELFVFEEEIDPAPSGDVSKPASAEYPAWLERVVETVELNREAIEQIELRLHDDDLAPMPNAAFEIDLGLGTPTAGATDAEGFARCAMPPLCPSRAVVRWGASEPAGTFSFERTFVVDCEHGQPAQRDVARLHNLGYGAGTERLEVAVTSFQVDYQVDHEPQPLGLVSGELPPATRALLDSIYEERDCDASRPT